MAEANVNGSKDDTAGVHPEGGTGADAPRAGVWAGWRDLRRYRLLRAFQHRNYRLFFSGQFISVCGTWMQTVAQSWLVYRLTGSALLLGLVGFCSQFPVLMLSPVTGAVADRYDRRRLIVATQIASMLLALVLAVLTLSGRIRVWHLPVLASLLGVVNALDVPARQAFVVEMVGKEDLLNAIALNSSMFNSARILGPSIGGVLVATIGEGWCFLANSMSYIAVIVGLLLMRLEARPCPPTSEPLSVRVAAGFHYVWQARPIRMLMLLLGLVSLLGMPYAVLMPIFAATILHGAPRALGVLMGAAGIGALSGALTLASRRGVCGLERWIAFSTAGFGASLILFASSRTFWLSAALLVPVGFGMIGQVASSNTLIQMVVPDALRGRVMSVYSMMLIGMAPFGSLLAGLTAQHLGAPWTVALCGCVCLVAAAGFGTRLAVFQRESQAMLVVAAAGAPAPGRPAWETTAGDAR